MKKFFLIIILCSITSCQENIENEQPDRKLDKIILKELKVTNLYLNKIHHIISPSYKGRIINSIQLTDGEKIDISDYSLVIEKEYQYHEIVDRYHDLSTYIYILDQYLKNLTEFEKLTSTNIFIESNIYIRKLLWFAFTPKNRAYWSKMDYLQIKLKSDIDYLNKRMDLSIDYFTMKDLISSRAMAIQEKKWALEDYKTSVLSMRTGRYMFYFDPKIEEAIFKSIK